MNAHRKTAMTSAVSQRLRELAAVASQLADLVDAEGRDLLPAMMVCRVAIAADETACRLTNFHDLLTRGRQPDSP